MSQSPNLPDPGQPQSAGYGASPDPYGQGATSGYAQAPSPAYGNGQQANPYSQQPYAQQPYGQQTAYGAPAYGAPYGQAGYVQPGYTPPKSKAAAAVLAFFLGGLGIHNFYRGQTRRGIGHLCLVAAAVGLFIIGGIVIVANTDDYGYTPDGPTAAAGLLFIVAWLGVVANSIWAFVEFIMILASNDGSLQ